MNPTVKVILILLLIICAIVLIIYFFIAPGDPKKCVSHKWLYQSKIAHRGCYNTAQGVMENSQTAFQKAIEKGLNIELDVSLSKDNEVIVYHDDDFKRLFQLDKKVCELTLKEIKELKYENSKDQILEFSECLQMIAGKTGLLIELKSQTKQRDSILCQKVMEKLKDYHGNYAIQSFNPLILREFKKKYPMVPRGQLYTKFNLKEEREKTKGQGIKSIINCFEKFCYNYKLVHFIGRPLFMDHDYKEIDFAARLCHHFMPLIVFTVNDVHYYDYCLKTLKVDNIIFENLEITKDGRAKESIS